MQSESTSPTCRAREIDEARTMRWTALAVVVLIGAGIDAALIGVFCFDRQ
jgi:hypothetical protein